MDAHQSAKSVWQVTVYSNPLRLDITSSVFGANTLITRQIRTRSKQTLKDTRMGPWNSRAGNILWVNTHNECSVVTILSLEGKEQSCVFEVSLRVILTYTKSAINTSVSRTVLSLDQHLHCFLGISKDIFFSRKVLCIREYIASATIFYIRLYIIVYSLRNVSIYISKG